MATTFELGSKAWIEELFRLLREAARKHPEMDFSVCEVFTKVPARLGPDAEGKVAWHGFLRGGEADLRIGEVPPEAVDVKTVGEWETIVPLAHFKINLEDPAAFARYQEMGEAAVTAGKVQRFGDRTKAPLALLAIHNELAGRTV